MGSTERYSSEYGPEKICRARVINKDEKKETIYGHPNATVSDILGRTYHVIRKFVTFSNDDGREFKLDNENAYDTFEIGDKANLTLRESFIAIWDYQPPNFDEKREIRRNRDPNPNRYDRVVKLEKLIEGKTGLTAREIDISKTKVPLSREVEELMLKMYYTSG